MALNPFFTPLLRTSPGDTAVYPDMSRELMPCKPSAGQKAIQTAAQETTPNVPHKIGNSRRLCLFS